MSKRKIVIIESPWSGNTRRNKAYMQAAMRDALKKGEIPFATHALFAASGVLDDEDPAQRELGMRAGFEINDALDADYVACVDLGISDGMRMGIERAKHNAREVFMRTVEGWTWPPKKT
jgi:hypothetical protein